VCFFLPIGGLPDRLDFQPSLVILDFRHSRSTKKARDLLQWAVQIGGKAGILALYWIGDIEVVASLTDLGFVDFRVDHNAVATSLDYAASRLDVQNDVTVDWWTTAAPLYLQRHHDVVAVQDDVTEEILAGIGQVLDEYSQRDNPDLNRARWMLAALTHLPVPMIWYEMAARGLGRFTLRRMIAKLGSGNRYDVGLRAVLQTLRMQFELAYAHLERANPRAETLRSILPTFANKVDSERVLMLVRDQVTDRALQTWLELEAFPGADWLNALNVRSCSEYIPESKLGYDRTVIIGALPRRHRRLAGAYLGKRVTFIVYPHEIDVIEHQLLSVYGEAARSARARRRSQTIQQLLPHKQVPSTGLESPLPQLDFTRPRGVVNIGSEKQVQQEKIVVRSLNELATALEAARRTSKEAHSPSPAIAPWQEDTKLGRPSGRRDGHGLGSREYKRL
jgi:hypothetical protein